jgi:hypothetical protein
MSLKRRIERLEDARSRGGFEIVRLRKDGWASLTEIRGGRVTRRLEVTPMEADRLARGGLVIERSYAAAERSGG